MKKDESIRIMLCTRNMPTIRLKYGMQSQVLAGHDRRCSISNGNLAVFDLVAGDARQFNIDRLTSYNSLGVISTMEELERAYEHFNNFVKLYNDSNE
jgi:hypothetical protein